METRVNICEKWYALQDNSVFTAVKESSLKKAVKKIENELIPSFEKITPYFEDKAEAEIRLIAGILKIKKAKGMFTASESRIDEIINSVIQNIESLYKNIKDEQVYMNGAKLQYSHLEICVSQAGK